MEVKNERIDLTKLVGVFNPASIRDPIHIIGCGSVGSCVAELLARQGLTNFVLYDFDVVEAKNISNQMFFNSQIGKMKVDAVKEILIAVNPEIEATIRTVPDGYNGQRLNGYVFLCVDSIELRRKISQENKMNTNIKAMFDGRTRLYDWQHYAADWTDPKMVRDFIKTMQFTDEEARAETPVSACGTTLSVATTVRMLAAIMVENFTNFVRVHAINKMVRQDSPETHFEFEFEAF